MIAENHGAYTDSASPRRCLIVTAAPVALHAEYTYRTDGSFSLMTENLFTLLLDFDFKPSKSC